jgi:hypothetical protein
MREEFVRVIASAGEGGPGEELCVVLGDQVDGALRSGRWGSGTSTTDGVVFWPWARNTLENGWSVAGFVWIDFSSRQPIELTVEFGEATRVSVVFGGGGMAPAKLASRWLPERGWGRLDYAVRWVLPDPKYDVDV